LPIVALPFKQFLIQKRAGSSFSFTDTTGEYRDFSLNKLPTGLAAQGFINRAKRLLANAGLIK
jgi:hypothetical protein